MYKYIIVVDLFIILIVTKAVLWLVINIKVTAEVIKKQRLF